MSNLTPETVQVKLDVKTGRTKDGGEIKFQVQMWAATPDSKFTATKLVSSGYTTLRLAVIYNLEEAIIFALRSVTFQALLEKPFQVFPPALLACTRLVQQYDYALIKFVLKWKPADEGVVASHHHASGPLALGTFYQDNAGWYSMTTEHLDKILDDIELPSRPFEVL